MKLRSGHATTEGSEQSKKNVDSSSQDYNSATDMPDERKPRARQEASRHSHSNGDAQADQVNHLNPERSRNGHGDGPDVQNHVGNNVDGGNSRGQPLPHHPLVLLGFKVAGWSLIFMYFILPAFIKTNSWIMNEVVFMHRLSWPPNMDLSKPALLGLNHTRNFQISTEGDNYIGAWHVLPEHLTKTEASDADYVKSLKSAKRPIVLYFHGNVGTRAGHHRRGLYRLFQSTGYHVITIDYRVCIDLPSTPCRGREPRRMLYQILADLGYHTIAIDYRGFGDSPGYPSEAGVIDDAYKAYSWVRKHAGDNPVYIWGHSLGSAITVALNKRLSAENFAPNGVVLEAPFNNLLEAAIHHPLAKPITVMPWCAWIVVDAIRSYGLSFASDQRIGSMTAPLIILHAKDDGIVPYALGEKLYHAALEHKRKGGVEFFTFEAGKGYGHKHIYKAENLPAIIKNFIN